MSVYQGEFSSWKDVQTEFEMSVSEPEQVLLAKYDTPPYEGYATVVYRNGDKLFLAEGSHCSCFGLEGQWEPEEYDRETFAAAMARRNDPDLAALAGVAE